MSNFYIGLFLKYMSISISSFMILFNFMIEVRMIYDSWLSNNPELLIDTRALKRKLMLFYFFYYLILFVLVTNIITFFTEDIYIIVLSSTIWIPAIIENIFKTKIKSPPMIIVIVISLNRVYHMLYNCMTDKLENILHTKMNKDLAIYVLFVISIQVCIVSLQCYVDTKFFLPNFIKNKLKKYNKKDNIKYYTINKFYKSFPVEKLKESCSICICQLVEDEKIEELKLNIKNNGKKSNVNYNNSNTQEAINNNTSNNTKSFSFNKKSEVLLDRDIEMNKVNDIEYDNNKSIIDDNNNLKHNNSETNSEFNNYSTSIKNSNNNNNNISTVINKLEVRKQLNNNKLETFDSFETFKPNTNSCNNNSNSIFNKFDLCLNNTFGYLKYTYYIIINNFNLYKFKTSCAILFNNILKVMFTFHHFNKIRTEEFLETECKHIFHTVCMKAWLEKKHQCPIDRKEIISEDVL